MNVAAIAGYPRARTLPHWFSLETIVLGSAIVALVVLVVLPVLSLLIASVWSEDGVTMSYFERALTGNSYLRALGNSLVLGSWVGLLSVVIGVPLAWAVSRTNVPGKSLIQATATLSYLAPPFLTSIAFVNLLSPNAGLINVLLRDVLGMPNIGFNIFTMTGLVFVTVLHTFPFVYLLASSALQSVDASYEEAAEILGAGKVRTALTITGPLVAPAILSGTLLAFVNAIALFGSQAIIGLPGRIVTLPTRIYSLFDYPPQYGLAAALSLLFVAITIVALYLQRAFLARRSYVTLAGKGARPQLVDLGGWRWALFAACVLVFFIAIVLPFGSLIAVSFSKSWGLSFWQNLTLDNYRFILFEYDVTRRAIINSLVLATVAATLCVLLGADHQLDRPAHENARPPLPRLCVTRAARPARHRHGGGAVAVLAFGSLHRPLRDVHDPASGLCRPLCAARRSSREFVAAPDRSVARGERAHSRRVLGPYPARDHSAADPARPVRRLASCLRAGGAGTQRFNSSLQFEIHHARGRRL